MSIFIQIVILFIVLSCMVMVLLAIRQLTHYESFDDSDQTGRLKEEVEDDERVMSDKSIFSNLVEMDGKNYNEKKNYKSTSKDPLSRRE